MSMRTTKSAAGFTIIEVLVALLVTGILLAAVAAAFNASFANYRENEDTFKAVNKARQALTRITTQIRTAGWYNAGNKEWYTVSTADQDNHNLCSLYLATGDTITYEYRSADNKLYLITNSDGKEYVMCDNVTGMTFNRTLTTGGKVKSVQISMTVSSGDTQQTISAAAVVRKNLP